MGAGRSRSENPAAVFDDFTTYMTGSLVEPIMNFLLKTPRVLPESKRKALTFRVDIFLEVLANATMRLKSIDSRFEGNVSIVTMYDAILHILWSALGRRYPQLLKNNHRVKRPSFIRRADFENTCDWLQQKIVTTVEILCQCHDTMTNQTEETIKEMRSNNPDSIFSVMKNELDAIEQQIAIIIQNHKLTKFQFAFYSQILVEFLGSIAKMREELLKTDIEAIKKNNGISASTLLSNATPSRSSSSGDKSGATLSTATHASHRQQPQQASWEKTMVRRSTDTGALLRHVKRDAVEQIEEEQRKSGFMGHKRAVSEGGLPTLPEDEAGAAPLPQTAPTNNDEEASTSSYYGSMIRPSSPLRAAPTPLVPRAENGDKEKEKKKKKDKESSGGGSKEEKEKKSKSKVSLSLSGRGSDSSKRRHSTASSTAGEAEALASSLTATT